MTKPNSKCPCGSGKKYKKCCKKRDQQLRGTASSGNKHLSVYQRGVRYELGEGGVEQNYSHALELFKLASRTSDNIKEVQDSFVNIGFFHERGFGTEQDYNKAREAYEVAAAKAIELNDICIQAEFNLGLLLVEGKGGAVDIDLALHKFMECNKTSKKERPETRVKAFLEAGHILQEGTTKEYGVNLTMAESMYRCSLEVYDEMDPGGKKKWELDTYKSIKLHLDKILTLQIQEQVTKKNNIVCAECNASLASRKNPQMCQCKEVYYCNTVCQAKHWPAHKAAHRLAKAKAKAAEVMDLKQKIVEATNKLNKTSPPSSPITAAPTTTTTNTAPTSTAPTTATTTSPTTFPTTAATTTTTATTAAPATASAATTTYTTTTTNSRSTDPDKGRTFKRSKTGTDLLAVDPHDEVGAEMQLDLFDNVLVYAAMNSLSPQTFQHYLCKSDIVKHDLNRTDGKMKVTPLMALAFYEDHKKSAEIAKTLVSLGALIHLDDGNEGGWPLMQAVQANNVPLVKFLLEKSDKKQLLRTNARNNSKSTILFIACQNGSSEVVACIVEAAADRGCLTDIVDATNLLGKTPCCMAVEIACPEAVGVLASTGADLARATPRVYSEAVPDLDDNGNDVGTSHFNHFNPTDNSSELFPVHFALDAAVQSCAHKHCCECKQSAAQKPTKRCKQCLTAYFCSPECLKNNWNSHKHVCKRLKEGRALLNVLGKTKKDLPQKKSSEDQKATAQLLFTEQFGPLDQICPDNWKEEGHPVWEYDAGTRGDPNWMRYPPRIENLIECLRSWEDQGFGTPDFALFRPGKGKCCDGKYEQPDARLLRKRPDVAPAGVATRRVDFGSMVERDVYHGAARKVRRNGVMKDTRTFKDDTKDNKE